MPFTGAHPAAVLPFFRVGFPAALVVGSMVPDFPYFVPVPVSAGLTHSGKGVWIDLLIGMLAVLWWVAALGPVARSVAPIDLRRKLGPHRDLASFASVRQLVLILVSLLVGVLTHIVWDEFTHAGRWGARHIGWLAAAHAGLGGYEWAQYASGALGLGVLTVTSLHWWRTTPTRPGAAATRPNAARCWAIVGGPTLVGLTVGFGVTAAHGEGFHRALFAAARVGGGVVLLTGLVVSVVLTAQDVRSTG